MTDTVKTNGSGAGTSTTDPAEEALNMLRGTAMAGELAAKIELSQRLLSQPRDAHDLLEGAAVVVSAANDGSGESAYRTAVLAAGAISMRRNWGAALIYCRRAAEFGYRPAQVELAALSSDQEMAARAISGEDSSPDIWARLLASIDLAAHMTPPNMKSVSINPRIATVENFIAPEFCDVLVETARGRLQPIVLDADEKEENATKGDAPVGLDEAGAMRIAVTDLSLRSILLLDRITELVGLPHRGLEPPAIFRYAGAKAYPAHVDYLEPTDPERAEMIANGGQRAITFLIFLNDDFNGGETDFPSIPLQFKAKKGDALFWWNISND
ncbi:MAG: 2OG-Fe(II) oxygenase [Micropepsaceae bacterium]